LWLLPLIGQNQAGFPADRQSGRQAKKARGVATPNSENDSIFPAPFGPAALTHRCPCWVRR